MVIKSLTLKNFGIHKFLKVNFDSKITVIIGDSNTGKSTIYKAIKLVFENKPSKSGRIFNYNHDDKNPFEITIHTKDCEIKRTEKVYLLKDLKTGEVQKFEKFGSDVPEPIKRLVPLQDINWKRQIVNQYFLILETPGQRAKVINKIIGMEDSDLIIGNIKKKIGDAKGEFKLLNQTKTENKETCKRLEKASLFLKNLQSLKQKEELIFEHIKEIKEISSIIDRVEKTQASFERVKLCSNFIERLEDLLSYKKDIANKEMYISRIKKVLNDLETTDILDSSLIDGFIDRLKHLLSINIKTLDSNIISISRYFTSIEDLDEKLKRNKLTSKLLESQILKELKEKGCPLCGKFFK